MSFSRAQQPEFRALVFAAWTAHCRHEGLALSVKPDREWYEQELFIATRHTSTSDCNAGRDYDLAMARFEELAGTGIKWQMKVHHGDANRMLHDLGEEFGEEALKRHRVNEDYLRATARQSLRLDYLPELSKLSRKQCVLVLGEVKRWLRRAIKRDAAPVETIEPEIPF